MQDKIVQAVDVIKWNRRIFMIFGLWPPEKNDRIFSFFFIFLSIHCCLEYAELIQYIDDLEYIVANLTENIILSLILLKIGTYRINRKPLLVLLENVQPDYCEKKYRTKEEKLAFLKYNSMTRTFIKYAPLFLFCTAISYYLRPLTGQLAASKTPGGNSSVVYVLPYRTRLFFEVTELHTYVIVYICQSPVMPLVGFYIGADCLLITLLFHVCGQLSILSLQVQAIMTDPRGQRYAIMQFVKEHLRIINIAKRLDATFNILLLQQLIGITILLCLIGYNVLANSEDGQITHLVTFVFYAGSMINILFMYCYIGECLIYESTKLSHSFYNCTWYNNPPAESKLFLLCMLRAQSPLVLTAGKFYIFSLQSFTDVVKTSMAYLSVLRRFLEI